MKKQFLLLFLTLITIVANSQEIASKWNISLKKDRDVFQIVDEENKNVTLFISDKLKVNALQLNDKLEITDSISTERPDKIYSNIIGFIKNENQKKIVWDNGNGKEVLIQSFDFNKKNISSKSFKFPLINEKIIVRFSYADKFYMVAAIKNTNNLKFYIFDSSDALSEKIVNMDGFKFFSSDFKKTTLYGVLGETFFTSEAKHTLKRINTESPTSLTYSSMKRKYYVENGFFTMTFDNNPDYTMVIPINLTDFKASEKILKSKFLPFSEFSSPKGNSFLLGDRIFQIKYNAEEFNLDIKDLDNNVIKSYHTKENETFSYKNSEIIQDNGSTMNRRILEKTSQFLRKVNAASGSVSVYQLGDNYLLKLGSISEVQSGGGAPMFMGGMYGATGVLVSMAFYNPTFDNFNSYASRKVVYFNSLLDKNGEHVNATLNPLAFDKIQEYLDQNPNQASRTIFKFLGVYYLGNYDTKEKAYTLRKFTD